MNNHFFLNRFILISILFGFSIASYAQEPVIKMQYNMISKKRISRTVFEYTLKAMLINGDTPIEQVSANVSSNSPFTTVIDGEINFNNMQAGAIIESSDTFMIRQDRLEALGPESLNWDISYQTNIPIAPEVDGIVDPYGDTSVREGQREGLDIRFIFSRKGAGAFNASSETRMPFTIQLNQTVEPATGLALSPDINDTQLKTNSYGSINTDTRQSITATQPGYYTITTTATILESGKVISETTKVKVFGAEAPYVSLSLHIKPSIVAVGSSGFISAGVDLGSEDQDMVTEVKVKLLETGETRVFHPGFQPNNLPAEFGGRVAIDTSQADKCYTYVAIAETPIGSVESERSHKICVTGFPIGYYAPPKKGFWESLITGTQYAIDILMISVAEGTSEQRIKDMAAAINGRVIGQSLGGGDYQIQLFDPPDIHEGFLAYYAEILEYFKEIEYLHMYYRSAHTLSLSNDPAFEAGEQPNLKHIRANEAWYVLGQDGIEVAVVDSGVNIIHDDLLTKLRYPTNVILGFDQTEITDISNHGTHVAGIIGAITNNGLGIAGVSRNSQVMPIRVGLGARNRVTNKADPVYWGDVINGMKEALGANMKVINVSIGVPKQPLEIDPDAIETCLEFFQNRGPEACITEIAITKLCNEAQQITAAGSLIVAAAGNSGIDMPFYPAGCGGVIAVGASNKGGEGRMEGHLSYL